jgi:hypothetical protein
MIRMRRPPAMMFVLLLTLPLMAACQLALPEKGGKMGEVVAPATPITAMSADTIEVTALPAPGQDGAVTPVPAEPALAEPTLAEPSFAEPAATAPDGPRPKPRPDAASVQPQGQSLPEAVTTPPPEPKSAAQIACEKTGSVWGAAGKSGGKTCITRTRDGGKECRRESDCEGLCLGRSRTCAPVKPLFGCNDILQDDGREVTLCID